MLESVKKFIEEVNDLKAFAIKEGGDELLKCSSDQSILLYMKAYRLLDTSMNLLYEEAALIDDMNRKLDMLLDRKSS